MLKQEKDILKKTVDARQGLLSPMEFINGICQRDEKSAHSLIATGFIEEVPHKVHDRDYIFYRATKKGRAVFYPLHKKAWHAIKSDIRTVIVSVITALLVTFLTLLLTGQLFN